MVTVPELVFSSNPSLLSNVVLSSLLRVPAVSQLKTPELE